MLTLGIPVKRLHTVVWVVASVLAFLGMFLRAGAVGLPIGEVLPPTFLVQALAAAVFGRFERFTTIAAAAIGLGIVDQAMTFQAGNRPAYNDAVLFGIVLAGAAAGAAAAPRPGSTPTPPPPGRPRGRSAPSRGSCAACPRWWGRGRCWRSGWGSSC